jgi:enediyne biosynthesis protein E4
MKPAFSTYFFLLILFLLSACDKKNNTALYELLDAKKSGIGFVNSIYETDSTNVLEFMNFYTGGGIAVGDVNNDSLPDLFFSGNMVSSRLYLNRSTKDHLAFEDVTEAAGVTTRQWITGVNMVDINQDGLLDIYACSSGSKNPGERENKLFINKGLENGIPRYQEAGREYHLNDTSYTTQAAFFDYDRDGDLDVFLIENKVEEFFGNKANLPQKKERKYDPLRSNKLMQNTQAERNKGEYTGTEKFIDVSEKAGVWDIGYNLGLAVSDVNGDGWPDIYIASDFLPNDVLYINNQDGTFTNRAGEYIRHTSYAGMGVDIADFNNDQRTDIAVVDMVPEDNQRQKAMMNKTNHDKFAMDLSNNYTPQYTRNTLQLNNGANASGKYAFSEIGAMAGMHHTDWSWSILFVDCDNDGWKDLFITNGFLRDMQDLDFVRDGMQASPVAIVDNKRESFLKLIQSLPPVKVPNYLFRNRQDFTFENATAAWGLNQPSVSNGAVYADLDNDGDLDLVVSNNNAAPFLYKNLLSTREKPNQHLKIRFEGPELNRDGIGARVEVKAGKQTQLYENFLTRGFQSSISSTMHIGLGQEAGVEELKVTWPDGRQQTLSQIKANTSLLLRHRDAQLPPATETAPSPTLFNEVSATHAIRFRHQDYYYNDFNLQRLIPFKLSQAGPALAVGDVDGNGTDDFYVGGGSDHPGTFFLQEKDCRFRPQPLSDPEMHEDAGALLLDADNDGDLDLYVTSGSVEKYTEEPFDYTVGPYYRHRLYVNDGKGNFTKAEKTLPSFAMSGSCVTAADFDRDGDLDLFVGGRSLPGQYPLPASSKLLMNVSNGKDQPAFQDVTASQLPALEKIGLVTAALWTDYNNDGWTDLIVVGEGMPITLFENRQGKLQPGSAAIAHNALGYWNSVVGSDFDGDGDQDYVIGNMGLNSVLKASPKEPVRVYARDFDHNGSMDQVLSYYLQGKEVPFHPRDEFIDQMFILRGRFPSYADFSRVTMGDIFKKEELDKAYVMKYENFQTSYLQNNGKAGFELKPLPKEAQISQIHGMLADDFDRDGIPDLLMAGNSYAPTPAIGWYDAGIGTLFKGKGDGAFEALDPQKTGLYVPGDVKAVAELITARNEPLVLVSNHADSLKAFNYRHTFSSFIPLRPTDAGAYLIYADGRKVKREFPYGSGYLSQSSRHLKVPNAVQSVTIYDFSGKERPVNPAQMAAK